MPTWLLSLDRFFPIRYITWIACAVLLLLGTFTQVIAHTGAIWAVLGGIGVIVGLRDVRQRRHSILRNYPVIGHLRFLLEFIRPEMRQYFIEGDNEAAPFSRQQRSLVYQRSRATRTSVRWARSWTCRPRATSGSTTRCSPRASRRTTFA